jgi:hypothetical protein
MRRCPRPTTTPNLANRIPVGSVLSASNSIFLLSKPRDVLLAASSVGIALTRGYGRLSVRYLMATRKKCPALAGREGRREIRAF